MVKLGHTDLTTFGIGTELYERGWRGVVRQLLAAGLLDVEGDYGMLGLTEASGTVLRGERQLAMRTEPERRKTRSSSGGGKSAKATADLTGAEAELFEQLRAWRAATAKEQGVPAYVVFHDATLRAIATAAPTTIVALGKISGVGAAKLDRYGPGVLETVAAATS